MKKIPKYAEFSPDEWGLSNDIFLEFVDEFQAKYVSYNDINTFIDMVYNYDYGIFWSKYEYTSHYGRNCKCFIVGNVHPNELDCYLQINTNNENIEKFLSDRIINRFGISRNKFTSKSWVR